MMNIVKEELIIMIMMILIETIVIITTIILITMSHMKILTVIVIRKISNPLFQYSIMKIISLVLLSIITM